MSWKHPLPDIERLLSVDFVRSQARRMFEDCCSGKTHFQFVPERLDECAAFVVQVTRERYPSLDIPFHSRWSHFNVSGVNRLADFERAATGTDLARGLFDLVLLSVLLDAGAGPKWSYLDPRTGLRIGKSEGLAVASLDWVLSGKLSNSGSTAQISADKLSQLTTEDLAQAFQADSNNPLVGLEGRTELLRNLGQLLKQNSEIFPNARCSDLLDWLKQHSVQGSIPAEAILRSTQRFLASMWPGRLSLHGQALGDLWKYSAWGTGPDSFIAFHKLSQWLTLSLIYSVERFGLKVIEVEALTPLPEYRNGGLLIDSGVLKLRQPELADQAHPIDGPLVLEWRALTVHVLELVADSVRAMFGKSAAELPTGKVLEGGTWAAGRILASQKRKDGGSPLRFLGDGTVI